MARNKKNNFPFHIEKQQELFFSKVMKRISSFAIREVKKQFRKEQKEVKADAENFGDLENKLLEDFEKTFFQSGFIKSELLKVALLLDTWTFNKTVKAVKRLQKLKKKTTKFEIPIVFELDNPFIQDFIEEYVKRNVELVKALGQEFIPEVSDLASKTFIKGGSIKELSQNLKEIAGISDSRARFWARDQVGDAYSKFTELRQKQAGIKNYTWETVGDNVVRDSHAALDGKVFSWKTGASGLTKPGAKHPGEDYNSYDKYTKVLTDNGYKYFYELSDSDMIATMNPSSYEIEYLKYKKIYKYVSDEIIYIKNKWNDIAVTKNHQMAYITGKDFLNKKFELKFINAENLKSDYRIPKTALWKNGKKLKTILINNKEYNIYLFIKFLSFYLADGSFSYKNNNIQIQIACSKKNIEKRKFIIDVCSKMFDKIWIGTDQIYICDKEIKDYLVSFGRSKDKFIPKNIKKLNYELLKTFLFVYGMTDGHRKSPNSVEYYTSSIKMVDDLCELILKTGGSPSVLKKKNNIFVIRNKISKFYKHKKIYSKTMAYNDYVYCVEMPKNNIINVMRNGKTIWCGNCRCTAEPTFNEVN